MKHICAVFAVLLFAAAAAGPAAAHSIVYTAPLSGANESPPNPSLGTGFVTVTVDFDLVTMHVEANFAGLTGVTTASHIHCCITTNPNVGVATMVPSFTGFPLGVQVGTFDNTFDMSLAASYNGAFITNNGGSVSSAMNALFNGLAAGTTYFNVHTSTSPGGEIRGNLVFDHVIPEPAALGLVALGLGALALRRRAA